MSKYHNKIQRNTQVAGYKGDMVKFVWAFRAFYMHERVEIFEDGDDNAESQGEICTRKPKRSKVMHFARIDTLSPAGLNKIDVRHKDGDPGKKPEDGY